MKIADLLIHFFNPVNLIPPKRRRKRKKRKNKRKNERERKRKKASRETGQRRKASEVMGYKSCPLVNSDAHRSTLSVLTQWHLPVGNTHARES